MAAEMSTAAAAAAGEALPPPDAAVDDAAQSFAQGDGNDGGSSARLPATDCCADSVTDENTPYELSSFEVVAPQPPPDVGSDSSGGFEKYLVWLLVAGLALVLAAFVIVVVWVRKRRATKLLIKNGPAGHGCAERGEGAADDDDDNERKTTDGRTASLRGKSPPTHIPLAARSAKDDLVLDADAQTRARSGGDDAAAAAMAITFVVGTDVGDADATSGARLVVGSATPDIVVGHSTDGAAGETAGGGGGSRARSAAAGDGAASAAPPSSNVTLLLPLPPQSAAGATMTTVASDGDDDAAGRRTGVPSRHRSAASRRTSGAPSSAHRTPSAMPTSVVTERATAAAAEPAATSAGRSSHTVGRAATTTEAAAASRGAGSAPAILMPDPHSPAAFSPDLLQTTTLTGSNHTLMSEDTYYGRRKLLTPRMANKMVSELIARNKMREKLEKQERIRNFAQRQSEERTKMKLQNWSDEEDDCESDRHGIELESIVAPSSDTA